MIEVEKAQILREAAHEVVRKDLTWGTSGNISCRLSDSEFLISASGEALGELELQDFVRCRCTDQPHTIDLKGARPSVEIGMHSAVYRSRPDVEVVLHASPFFTTLVASSSLEPDPNLTTDTAYYLRQIRRVRFQPPGSTQLAHEAAGAAAGCNALILANHGALTVGQSAQEAVSRMEILEILCRMTVYGGLGIPLQALSEEQVARMMRLLEGYATA